MGTGMEYRAAVDTGDVILAERGGKVAYVDADHIEIDAGKGDVDTYDLVKFMRSNQGTLIHQKPHRVPGRQGRARAPCSPTARPPTTASSRSAATSWSPS